MPRQIPSTQDRKPRKGEDGTGRKLPRYGHKWDELSAHIRRTEPLCRLCLAEGRTVAAVCVDHIKPIAAGGDLLDPKNLQPLCAECHDRKTLKDVANGARRGEWPARITIVCGPPKAGLTTHVRAKAEPTDHVFEWRDIQAALGLPNNAREAVRRVRDALLQAALEGHLPGRLWVTMTDHEHAEALARRYGAKVEWLATPIDVCLDRIRTAASKRQLTTREADELRAVVARWHATHDAGTCPPRPLASR